MNSEKYFDLLISGEFEQAERLRISAVPDKLYKYVTLDGSCLDDLKFITLENGCIWFSRAELLNDPYEGKAMLLDRNKIREASVPDEVIDIYESMFGLDDLGLACFSGSGYDNLPLWAYYANRSKGFCIEYNVINKKAIHEVFYEPKRIKIGNIFLEIVKNARNAMEGDLYSKTIVDSSIMILMQSLYMKDVTWKHESEYRIIYPSVSAPGENIDAKLVGLSTARIIAGISCSAKMKKRLNDISRTIGCGNIYSAITSIDSFGIGLERYNDDSL